MLKDLTAIYGVADAEVVAPAHDKSPAKDMMKQRCLMAEIKECSSDEDIVENGSFKADLAQAAIDSKLEKWDSSALYQVKNFISYSLNEKVHMFDCLRIDLSKSNQLYQTLNDEITHLKE